MHMKHSKQTDKPIPAHGVFKKLHQYFRHAAQDAENLTLHQGKTFPLSSCQQFYPLSEVVGVLS